MRFLALVLVVHIQLCHIYASPPGLPEVSNNRGIDPGIFNNQNQMGYECGNIFFTDEEIFDSLSVALASMDKDYIYPERYQGLLYSDSETKEYFLWPIRKGQRFAPNTKYAGTTHRIAFTRTFEEGVDVIAKITTNEYTRCIRRGIPNIGLPISIPQHTNGYLCGHKFITDESIQEYLPQALHMARSNKKSLSPYVGLLYPEDNKFEIMPVSTYSLLRYRSVDIGPYFLIVDKEGMLKDAVVRGFRNNLIRCIRSGGPPEALVFKLNGNVPKTFPKSGYQCGRVFFEDKDLWESADLARTQLNAGKCLEEYSGPPINEPCYIIPIFKDGSPFQRGFKGPYRLAITKDFSVKMVLSSYHSHFKPCERKTLIDKKRTKIKFISLI